jgi:hypothetical protein
LYFIFSFEITDILGKSEESVTTDVSKKPEEHKTVIAIGQNNEKEVTKFRPGIPRSTVIS